MVKTLHAWALQIQAGRGERLVGQTAAILILVLPVVILIGVAIFLPRFLMRRAVRRVIALFAQREATSPEKAIALREVGLDAEGPFDRILRVRDYRPYAARLLGQAGILRATDEGMVYLSQDDLTSSPVGRFARLE